MVDFLGQKTSEYLYYAICLTFGVVGWLIGYFYENFGISVRIWGFGLVSAVFLVVPDWKVYNTKPVQWLRRVGDTETETEAEAADRIAKKLAKKGFLKRYILPADDQDDEDSGSSEREDLKPKSKPRETKKK